MDDEKIIDLFFARSEQAIEKLSAKYGGVIRRLTANILGGAADAEECENDTYLACWNAIPPQRPSPLQTYVCRVARNLAVKRYHYNTARKRRSSYDAALDELEGCLAAPESTESQYDAAELSGAINAFLEALDSGDRLMFVRRYFFSQPVREIAASLGLSDNRVSVRLFRLRDKLKRYLIAEGVTTWIER